MGGSSVLHTFLEKLIESDPSKPHLRIVACQVVGPLRVSLLYLTLKRLGYKYNALLAFRNFLDKRPMIHV